MPDVPASERAGASCSAEIRPEGNAVSINALPDDARYAVMDGRAAYDTDAASIIVIGSAVECCRYANSGNYGSDVVVVDLNTMEPCWEWRGPKYWAPDPPAAGATPTQEGNDA
jgi:hypothetical protein